MLSNNQVAFLCLLFALLGLAAFALVSASLKPVRVEIGELSGEFVGRFVELRGAGRLASSQSNYLRIVVCSAKCVWVSVSPALARQLAERGVDLRSLRDGKGVVVQGVLRESDSGFFLQPVGQGSVEII